jgi:hypothetical protein
LLLDQPLKLPVVGSEVPLSLFFQFGPCVVVVAQAALILIHFTLRDKINALSDQRLSDETIVQAVSSHFGTQVLLNHLRGLRRVAVTMTFVASFGMAPIGIILWAQFSFLPYHDAYITLWNKTATLGSCLLALSLLWLLPSKRNRVQRLRHAISVIGLISVALFSWLVATVPDTTTDQMMARLYGVEVETSASNAGNAAIPKRQAFVLTAYIFESEPSEIDGKHSGWLSRNLVVVDQIVADPARSNGKRVSLRGRNLDYAVFDRSTFKDVDFVGASMRHARLNGANLDGARIGCAGKPDGREVCT